MPRTLPPDLTEEKDKEENRPIELYQVFLDDEPLYLAMHPLDVEYFDENGDPQTYRAAAMKRNPIETNIETKVDQCEVSLGNVNREMSEYIAQTNFSGRKLRILKVFLDKLEDPENHIVIFEGVMDSPQITYTAMSVTVTSMMDKLDKNVPGRTFQIDCPWTFGGEECGRSVPELTGTIEDVGDYEGGVQYFIIDVDWNIEESEMYREGSIEINGERRKVMNTEPRSRISIAYPIESAEEGDEFLLKAGCDKGYDSDLGCEYWENTDYYGGFLSIPERKASEF